MHREYTRMIGFGIGLTDPRGAADVERARPHTAHYDTAHDDGSTWSTDITATT